MKFILLFYFLSIALVQATDCNDYLKKLDTTELDRLFAKPASELTPDELAYISKHAQALDDVLNPINVSADRTADVMLENVRKYAKAISNRLLKAHQKGEVPVYDVTIVGITGVHGGMAASAIQTLNPRIKMIGIDAGNGTSKTFDNDFFHLNSSESPIKSDTPMLYQPNQLKDVMPNVDSNVYPRARALANAKDFGLGGLNMDLVLENPVVSAIYGTDELWTVTLANGITFKSRTIIKATGYGKTVDHFLDEESKQLIEKSTAGLKLGKLQGAAVSFDDLRQQIELFKQANLSLDEGIENLDMVIVGGGDGGSVVAERMTKIKGRGKKLWLGQEGSSGEEFIQKIENKKRYADLAPKIDNHEIEVVKGYVVKLREFMDKSGVLKVEVTYTLKDDKTERKVITDVVIMATGYEKVPDFLNGAKPRFFATQHDPELPGIWDIIRKREGEFHEKFPDYVPAPGLYSVGVDASTGTGFFSLSRGGGTTLQIAKEVVGHTKGTRELLNIGVVPGAISSTRTGLGKSLKVSEPKIAIAGIRSRLLQVSRNFSFGGDLKLSIGFFEDELQFFMKDLAPNESSLFLKALTKDQEFLGFLRDYKKTNGTLIFNLPRTKGGGLRMDQAKITYLP